MKNLIFILIFISFSSTLLCQNRGIANIYGKTESISFIRDFVNFYCKSDTLTFSQFDEYFSNAENEFQMELAQEMYVSNGVNITTDCDTMIERFRYSKTPELMDYFNRKLNFLKGECEIEEIIRLDIQDVNAYAVKIKNMEAKQYIFVLTYQKSEKMVLWDILDEEYNSYFIEFSSKYYIDRLKARYAH